MSYRGVGRKPRANRFSIPNRSTISKRATSKNITPTEDLTTIINNQEANINDLSLRLDKMEHKIKNIEGILTRVNIIEHVVKGVGKESGQPADGNIQVTPKHEKSSGALKKQENMYRALGIKPPASSS
ncbi:uncharacterized protein EAF01_009309 [Botrytis porri]|uniref:Uncharacterized protein n=1 Tax=Botrytis porri TaxID=87229 RepID=A0A4Z1KHX9_9HELO|nr:uncharacterized protein EAF01_009309 [Botrytis porri]KAF7896906.1 hypothetical protein EAF01_009309 [Botrytis porri]TGO85667.1 hypothetical protein BPOR_0374g00010 [Botrytis porri]